MFDSGVSTGEDPEARPRGQSETEDTPLLRSPSPAPSRTHSPRDHALGEAYKVSDVAAVRRLLASGASPTQLVDGTTLLHMSIYKTSLYLYRAQPHNGHIPISVVEIFEAMLAVAQENGDLQCLDKLGRTPLVVAIESNNLKTVQAVVNAGARTTNLNRAGGSALHIASMCNNPKVVQYFLDKHEMPNTVNKEGNAPIHYAAATGLVESVELLLEKFGSDQMIWRNCDGSTAWHEIAGWDSIEVAQYLFQTEYSWDLNVVDNDGMTPLCIAAKEGNDEITTLLLRNGAALSVKYEKDSAVKYIASNLRSLTCFENILDECIHEYNLSVYYEVFSDKDMSQIKVLKDLVRFGLSKTLKHPTIESLIYIKWRCLLPVFYTIIMTYVIFMLPFNIFVITTFNNMDTWNATGNATEAPRAGVCGRWHWTLVAFIYVSTAVLITQECIWIYLQKLRHFYHPETWLKLSVLALALAVPVLLGCPSTPAAMTWQRHVACLALLLAWLQALLLLSRFSGWGYYVLMLERVAINILKILPTTIFLVIGFSTCLMIQYQSKPPFDGPGTSVVKTLVMMLSEFDYEGLFGKDHAAELENTKIIVLILFVVFVIFIAIVLMNFLISVGVSDVKELNDIANIRRLENQVELLSTLEGLGDTMLAKWWRRLLFLRFHRKARCLSTLGRTWDVAHHNKVIFRETFSAELHNAILNVAKKKK